MQNSMCGKVVVVTGGTKGIGKNIVEKLVASGAHVIATYRSDSVAADDFYAMIPPPLQPALHITQCDNTNPDQVAKLFDMIYQYHGRLDILINNAGRNADQLFLEMHIDQWQSVMETNLSGTLITTTAAIPLMKKNNDKKYIINMASISGRYGKAGQANYACSKGGIVGYTKLLAHELIPHNIHPVCLVPGLIDTNMAKSMEPHIAQSVTDLTFLKRIGQCQEVTNMILYLIQEPSTYIAGSVIHIDGGFMK